MPRKVKNKQTDFSSGSPTFRQFHLYKYVLENGNKTHVISRTQIFEYFRSQEIETSLKAFYSDLEFLRNEMGVDIKYDEKKHGYYVSNPTFQPHELRLIIDSIQASKFLTQKAAHDLCQKIKDNFTDKYTRTDLNRQAFVAGRARSMNDSVIKDTDRIYQAIAENSKISFRYFHFVPDNKNMKHYSKATNGRYSVSPYALYWNNGYLYLYAYTDKKEFRYFRVDRMDTISIPLGLPREGTDEFKATNVIGTTSKIFNMYGGPEYDVRMRFSNHLASNVIDEFGDGILMIPDEDGKHFSFSAAVQVSPTFYSWISTFKRGAKILGPEPVVDGMKKFLREISEMYENDGDI